MPGSISPRHHGRHRPVLAVEHPRRSLERALLLRQPGHLDHRAHRRQRAGQHVEPTLGVDRVRHRVHDRAVGRRRVDLGQVLRHRLAGHRHLVTVQQPLLEQVPEHDGHAADAVEIAHVELAARLHVGDVRHTRGDLVEVVEIELDAGLVGDRQQVQHGVGRTAERVGERDRVLERALGQDVVRSQPDPQHVDDRLAGAARVVVTPAVDGGRRRRARQRQPERLPDRAHRVGGEHAAAGALARAGVLLDRVQLLPR